MTSGGPPQMINADSETQGGQNARVRSEAARRQAAQIALQDFVAELPGGPDGKARREAEQKRQESEAGEAQAKLASISRKLRFVVNHETSDVTINVINSETNEVIRVLPPEELRRINSGHISGEGTGVLINQEA
jgi:uncharacterized FlaG/YvyC family protein